MSILDLIRPPEIKVNPASTAILYNNEEITYRTINSLVNKTSYFLNEKGVKENDIVALLFSNSLEFIITLFSLWEIGAVPVPLNIKLSEKELNEQVEFLKPQLSIKEKSLSHLSLQGKSITFSLNDLPDSKNKITQHKFSTDKTALILFTSGSSDKPKAVMLGFNNLIQSALIGNKVLKQTNKDRWLASLPFYHIGGFSIVFRTLFFGASLIIPASLSNEDLKDSINHHRPTLASLVSNQLKKFVDENFVPPVELRMVLLGGGFFDTDLILKAITQGWKIAKVYGSTETSSFVSFMNTNEVRKKPEASGKAVQPNKIIITGDGEIAVESPAVMKGYYNNDKETSSKLRDGFYYTGDIGHIDEEGYLFVEAKRNDLIITGGENVNPVEVEKAVLSHKNVSDVCVIGIQDKRWGQIISAAVVLKESSKLTEDELKNFLKEKLAPFKIPKRIIFLTQLPKTELGKVLKENVKKLFT